MEVYQIINSDGDHAGLFISQRKDTEQVKIDIHEAFGAAKAREEHYYEMEYEEDINVTEEAIDMLEKKEVYPVWAEEVLIDVI